MKQFSEYDRRQIVGSKSKLMEFKKGEDIETLFNRIRPKYPIRKYVDIFDKKLYNENMKKYEQKILEKFENFDISTKEKAIESFKNIWQNEKAYKIHLKKRLRLGHIEDEHDYVKKTLKCLKESKEVIIAKYNISDIWDRIRYFDNKEWIVIFAENGTLLTSHKKEKTELSFISKHKNLGAEIIKGVIDDEFRKFFKNL